MPFLSLHRIELETSKFVGTLNDGIWDKRSARGGEQPLALKALLSLR